MLGVTPCHFGEMFIICGTFFVFILYSLFGRIVFFAVDFNDSFCSCFFVCVNEYFDNIVAFTQNVVCTSADYNARTFFGKLFGDCSASASEFTADVIILLYISSTPFFIFIFLARCCLNAP